MVRLNKKLDPTRTGQDAEKLHTDLQKRIVGQDEAIDQIVNIYQMYLAGMNSPGRPIGNFLFLGPTGSGKTRVVEASAEILFGSMRRSSTMGMISGTPFLRRWRSASRSGSPGISGPLVPGAGFVARKTRI